MIKKKITEEFLVDIGFEKQIVFDGCYYYDYTFINKPYCDLGLTGSLLTTGIVVRLFPYGEWFQYHYQHEVIRLINAIKNKPMNMKVENMESSNGNKVANQFVITTDEGQMFQSYNSNIAFLPSDGGKVVIGKNWDYSNTTGKYRNLFLGETKKQTQAKIDSGEYIYDENL